MITAISIALYFCAAFMATTLGYAAKELSDMETNEAKEKMCTLFICFSILFTFAAILQVSA